MNRAQDAVTATPVSLYQRDLAVMLRAQGKMGWVKAYSSIDMFEDERTGRYLLVEEYGPGSLWWSEAWRAFHFPKTSSLVDGAFSVGNRTFVYLREGYGDLDLVPSLSPIGIQALTRDGAAAHITYAGLGGGGVSASYGRGLADGVDRIEIHHHGGGEKIGVATLRLPTVHRLLLIAVDDTDTAMEGATYATVANIAEEVCRHFDGVSWVINVEVNLFPHNPRITRNGFASLAGFKIRPGRGESVSRFFAKKLLEHSRSRETAMCSYEGFDLPRQLITFSERAQNEFVESVAEAIQVARSCNIVVTPVTGYEGAIGALAALGFWNRPQEAVDISRFLIAEKNERRGIQ